MKTLLKSLLVAVLVGSSTSLLAQDSPNTAQQEAAYTRTITQRADKIVATIGLKDPAKATRVRDVIVQQYRDLRQIHDNRDAQVKAAKDNNLADKATGAAAIKTAQDRAKTRLAFLHTDYLAKLAKELTPEQVDLVKDGMTYGVVQVTYYAYLKMLPDLTEAQKRQIKTWLVEARETAMDEGTSDDKHKVFGKYKGRINNYLSAAGYNLKQAEQNLKTSKPPSGENAK